MHGNSIVSCHIYIFRYHPRLAVEMVLGANILRLLNVAFGVLAMSETIVSKMAVESLWKDYFRCRHTNRLMS